MYRALDTYALVINPVSVCFLDGGVFHTFAQSSTRPAEDDAIDSGSMVPTGYF